MMEKRKDRASIQPALTELERVYDHFAPRLGLADKPRPVIVIQTVGRKQALGWMHPCKWGEANPEGGEQGNGINEITIGAEHLARPAKGLKGPVETMIHEMVHHANALDGVRDCNREQYHNRKFRDRAEKVGLVVTKMGRFGWGATELGPELAREVVGLNVDEEAFLIFRRRDPRTKAPTKLKKWSCGCTNVRVATDFDATCNICGNTFEEC